MRRHGQPPWRWRDVGRRPPRMPPPFVRRMGCAFAALIVLAAIGASTLVSLLWRIAAAGARRSRRWPSRWSWRSPGLPRRHPPRRRSVRRAGPPAASTDGRRRPRAADAAGHPAGAHRGAARRRLPPRREPISRSCSRRRATSSRLVEDLGTLAHAEAGALELRKEAVDLGDLVRDVAAALPRPIAVEVPADLPAIEADPVRIRQVLLNLLANALRHTPAEGVVSVEVQAQPQQMLIRVRDTGSGIAPEDLPRLFERFQKGSDSRGSGLGLAIARKLVLAHGGDIGIESAPGKGTEVTVSLPRPR